MLASLLLIRPHLRGTLVDFPRSVARAAEAFRSAKVENRVTAIGQSFFDPLPAGADLYLLRGVINNWDDPEATAILRRCAEAARPAGRVVILKSVGAENARRGISISTLITGGKDRSVSEFSILANISGLEVVASGLQPSGYFVVECRPLRSTEAER